MVRRSRKPCKRKSKGIYNVDVQRYSIYPSTPKPKEYKPIERVREGAIIEVIVNDVDERGSGIAKFGEYNVIILGDVNVGQRVRVRVNKIHRNTLYTSALET